jgi:restriction system protein
MSRSTDSAKKTLHAAFQLLKKNGPMPLKEVLDHVEQTVTFNAWEQEVYEKTGYVRWRSLFHFYSVDAVKAGLLVKNKGVWTLTPEGEKMLAKGPEAIIKTSTDAYRDWARERRKGETKPAKGGKPSVEDEEDEEPQDQRVEQKAFLEQMDEKAREGIIDYLRSKNPYEFQDMVAALLRAMGYHTPFVAERGPDGGVDIIAYLDPLGFKVPRVIVQVKRRPEETVTPAQVQSLIGTLNKSTDVGLFVTLGTFSRQAARVARTSSTHCELIDGNRFIELWKEHYGKMPDEDRTLMPLHAVWFLGEVE